VRREASLPRKARFIDELATKVDVGPHSLAFRVTRGKLVDAQLPLPGIHCVGLALILSEIVPALRVKVAKLVGVTMRTFAGLNGQFLAAVSRMH